MSRKTVEGLILENRDYRERDAIVTIALPREVRHFFARGVQPETSKNRRLCMPFAKVQIEVQEAADGAWSLIHGTPLMDYSRIGTDLRMQAVCLAVNEAAARSSMDPGIYDRIEALWQACQKGDPAWMGRAVLVFCALLKAEGIWPQVDGCAVCGSAAGIRTMDVEASGFLCARHSAGRPAWAPERLRRIRHAVKVPAGSEERIALDDFDMEDIVFFANWFSRYSHAPLHAARFLKTIAGMYA